MSQTRHRPPGSRWKMAVLCGGANSRLDALGGTLYKPFLPIRTFGLVARHILRGALAGVDEITLVIDYADRLVDTYVEAIQADVAAWCKLNVLVAPGSTAAKILAYHDLRSEPTSPLLVMLGDTYAHYDPGELCRSASQPGMDSAMTIGTFRLPFGVVETADGVVVEFVEKPQTGFRVNLGHLALGPRAIALLKSGMELDHALPELARQGIMTAVELHGDFMAIDTLADVAAAVTSEMTQAEAPLGRAAIAMRPRTSDKEHSINMTTTDQTKPTKYAVALAVKRDDGAFLTIRRPDDDPSLPGVWGLPAVSRHEDESVEDAAVRVGIQKLGVEVKLGRFLGEDSHERRTFVLRLSEFEAEIVEGNPAVPQPDTSVTQYVELRYTHDPTILIPAAQAGSVCSRIFLTERGVSWRETEEAAPTN